MNSVPLSVKPWGEQKASILRIQGSLIKARLALMRHLTSGFTSCIISRP